MLGSRGRLWPASAPVGVSVWSWKLLGSGRELELGAETRKRELDSN